MGHRDWRYGNPEERSQSKVIIITRFFQTVGAPVCSVSRREEVKADARCGTRDRGRICLCLVAGVPVGALPLAIASFLVKPPTFDLEPSIFPPTHQANKCI